MKRSMKNRLLASLMSALAAIAPLRAAAEDIDIFVGSSAGSAENPKILIVLDNTSNWARQSQQWPGGIQQGQSEANAIKTVLASIGSNVNIGLMEFVTGGNANDNGGFIRQAIQPMIAANVALFDTQLTTIYNNINDPNEKRNSNTPYGNLMYDVYNYFSGGNSYSPNGVVASKADSAGYDTNYTKFKSPLSDANSCGRNFIIFIGNPNSSGPAADDAANSAALTALGGSASPQIQVPNFTTATATTTTNLGYTSQCYASQAACVTTDYATQCATGAGYDSCSCSNTNTTTSLDTCSSGQQRYSVVGVTNSGGSSSTTTSTSTSTNTGTSACFASAAAANTAGDHGGLTCPSNTTTTSGNSTTTITNSCTYAAGSSSTSATQNCAAAVSSPVLGSNIVTTSSATTSSCYGGISTGNPKWNTTTDYAGLTCPTTTVTTSGNTTTTTTYACAYAGAMSTNSAGCSGADKHVTVTQTATGTPSTTTATPNYKYDVVQTVTASSSTITTSGGTSTTTALGNTNLCYASCSTSEFSAQCSSYNGGCSCSGTPASTLGQCPSGARYMVTGNTTGTVVTPTGTYSTPSTAANADEWARFLHQANTKNSTDTIKQAITTYTIDVFNQQQNADATALYMSMARMGGGKYFSATNEAAIVSALKQILAEIQSVNTTFASASLPVSATNRTQNANQVFIGMFRPDPDAKPRWFGNLKQYAIGKVNGDLDLVDMNGNAATNTLTGFLADCATSFWTTDSSNYWSNIVVNPDPASTCATVAANARYSDLPDGPTVEKGAVAEVLRKGNDPSATPSWLVNRTMYTLSGNSLVNFTLGAGGLSNDLVNFSLGKDVNNDTGSGGASSSITRPSIHGDVVHSRPLPINYGAGGVTVYYGANDGALRAVDASTSTSLGKERWSFIAPEFYSRLQRLKDNSPLINYPNIDPSLNPQRKDYFFDGSIGVYQDAANTNVWIYPTQRRGGRMVYAFNVSNPASPALKWRLGCPNLDNDNDCSTGFNAIGQTWSTPNVAFIKGFSTTTPVVAVGGGYDGCEDANTSTPSCGSTKGNVVYFINADTGALIRSFSTTRGAAADVAFIDLNNDGFVDYAYVADTGGNVYRIDFVSAPGTLAVLDEDDWFIHRVAYTNGSGRKFLFQPGLFPTGTSTYVALVSGDREHPLASNYPYTGPVVNRAYVYKDDLTSTALTAAVDLDGADMLNFTDPAASTCTSDSLLSVSNSSKKGWYMNLNQYGTGEQGVTTAIIVGGMVTFSTNRPIASAAQSCGSVLGEARGYWVNLFNASGSIGTANNASCGGDRSNTFAGGGLPPSPVIGIVPVDGQPTAVVIGAVQRDGSSSSPIKPDKIVPPILQNRTRTYKYIKGDN